MAQVGPEVQVMLTTKLPSPASLPFTVPLLSRSLNTRPPTDEDTMGSGFASTAKACKLPPTATVALMAASLTTCVPTAALASMRSGKASTNSGAPVTASNGNSVNPVPTKRTAVTAAQPPTGMPNCQFGALHPDGKFGVAPFGLLPAPLLRQGLVSVL